MTCGDSEGHKRVAYINFTINAISQSVFELEISCKDQNNRQKYANSMVPFPRYSNTFPSPDVINIIFRKTAITPSFFKTTNQNIKISRMSYQVIPILKPAHFCAEIGKKVFQYGYHAGLPTLPFQQVDSCFCAIFPGSRSVA